MDRQKVNDITKRVQAALAPVAAELGVSIEYKGGKFGDGYLRMTIEVAEKGADGIVSDREAERFKGSARLFGFTPDQLGASFQYGGRSCRIVGMTAGGKVIGEQNNGKKYTYPADVIARLLPPSTLPSAAISRLVPASTI